MASLVEKKEDKCMVVCVSLECFNYSFYFIFTRLKNLIMTVILVGVLQLTSKRRPIRR